MCAGFDCGCCEKAVILACGCDDCHDPNCWSDEQFWRWDEVTRGNYNRIDEFRAGQRDMFDDKSS